MKRLLVVMAVSTLGATALALGAAHRPAKVTDEQVQAAIDARLLEILKRMNAERSLAREQSLAQR